MKKLKEKVLKRLHKNSHHFNLLKAAEEASELSAVLLQRVNKGPLKVSDKKIIEEIGDLKIRLWYLEAYYGKESVKNRIINKFIQINKYANSR